ncbi:MAG: 2,3-bisphosphoglycerate-dependent phosphoglycerate mutase, partial [Actinomycetota bacterium]|nr:2,3-bisphosphoglycerate-dependent phosphoglycerate mutase [Actinomycetota bacterium]
LLLVRHAEPERVEAGRGVPANPSLTERGRVQADRLAEWLAGEKIDAVVSSPQQRAIETAAPIAAAHSLQIDVVEGIVEFDVQADDYIPIEELKATNDPRWRAMVDGTWHDFGGEDPTVFRTRVLAAVDQLISTYAGQRVVAVCHGGVVNVALGAVLGIDRPLWFDPAYTSLSRIAASRNGVRSLVSLNETAHLEARRGT